MPEIFLHLLFSRWFSHSKQPPPRPPSDAPQAPAAGPPAGHRCSPPSARVP